MGVDDRATDVVICGAGIAGVAAAYSLAIHRGVRHVVLVDERAPLTLTSDKSTEAYRNWWPGPDDAMVCLMNRSIDLLDELARASSNRFLMNRRGYLFATADPSRAAGLLREGQQAQALGAGPLRVHERPGAGEAAALGGEPRFDGGPAGADLVLDRTLIQRHFPYLSEQTRAVLWARRCGWFSGQQLGMMQLEAARTAGVRLLAARLQAVDVEAGRVRGVRLQTAAGERRVRCERLVLAAGPFLGSAGRMLGVELPVFSELHVKMAFEDVHEVLPRRAPLLIWEDPQTLRWSDEERSWIAQAPETRWLLDQLPAGVHARAEGGSGSRYVLVLWPYHREPVAEVFPIPEPPHFAEVALRGMATMVPGFAAYLERLPRTWVDGGYYTKTQDNRPLIGALPVAGAFVLGALSGFGLMASQAAAELLTAHMTGAALPSWAPAFVPARFADAAYAARVVGWGDTRQL